MTKRIDWDDVARKQKTLRHGSASAYDELPPIGSLADRLRQEERFGKPKKKPSAPPTPPKRKAASTNPKQSRRALARLVHICRSPHWKDETAKFRGRVLAAMALTLKVLLREDPAAKAEEIVRVAHGLLSKSASSPSQSKSPNPAVQGTLRDKAAQRP